MPVIVELRLRPERLSGYVPTTVQLHGLTCVLFEGGPGPGGGVGSSSRGGSGGGASHGGQEKPFAV
jgi:hypothetical protein